MARSVVITGSRDWPDTLIRRIKPILAEVPDDYLLILGGAPGVDEIARRASAQLQRPYMVIPARWDLLGKPAGPIRNRAMLDIGPEMVLAFSRFPITRGTYDAMEEALTRGHPVKYYTKKDGPYVFRSLEDLESFSPPRG